jgi:hypothetical protein
MPASLTLPIHQTVADYSDPTPLPKTSSLSTRPNAPPPAAPGRPPPLSSDPRRDRDDFPRPVDSLSRYDRVARSISQRQESSHSKTQVVVAPSTTHGWSSDRHTSGPGPALSYGASSTTLVENRDPSQVHWVSYIFGGNRWRSRYLATSQL